MFILDLLLHSRESSSGLVSKVLGCFFLMLGSLIGIFFLFQALAPKIGYLESGAIVCMVLVILGVGLLFVEKKKKPSPPEEAAQKALNFFKELDVEKVLKDNALTLSLLSLGGGMILSQLKNVKNLSGICKMLK